MPDREKKSAAQKLRNAIIDHSRVAYEDSHYHSSACFSVNKRLICGQLTPFEAKREIADLTSRLEAAESLLRECPRHLVLTEVSSRQLINKIQQYFSEGGKRS